MQTPARKRRGRPPRRRTLESPEDQEDGEARPDEDAEEREDVAVEGVGSLRVGGGRSREDDSGADLVELFQRNARYYGR